MHNSVWICIRFAELSWFWDSQQKWLLPFRCNFCKLVIGTEVISQNSDLPVEATIIECPHCFTNNIHTPQYTFGDPRNIALIGHWDGWQSFSTSIKHSCGMYA